ncbi:MAG: TetR/AcrR family transcriptional regulator [Spongiibacteraceae bacterium]
MGVKLTETVPVRARAKRMSPKARQAQLIRCAIALFAEKGIGATGHTDVAERAQVSIPTTFHYFPAKENMVSAVLDEVSRFLLDEIVVTQFDREVKAAESIEDLLMTFCDAIDDHPDYIRVWLEWSVAVRGDIWLAYLRFYAGAIRGIKKILLRGLKDGSVAKTLDIDDAARVIVGVAHMVTHMKFAKSSRDTVQHTVHSLVSGYLSDRKGV